jgi:hypothetical protein
LQEAGDAVGVLEEMLPWVADPVSCRALIETALNNKPFEKVRMMMMMMMMMMMINGSTDCQWGEGLQ